MKRVAVYFGMSRSGHHAVMNWMAQQFPGKVDHFNHCYGVGVDADDMRYEGSFGKCIYRKSLVPDRGTGDSMTIYSIEDFLLRDFDKFKMGAFREVVEADEVVWVLVVRDHFNWIASCLKKEGMEVSTQQVSRWAGHMRFANQSSAWVGDYGLGRSHAVVVNYNQWFVDERYRRELAEALRVPFTDAGKDAIPSYGRGSSWTEMQFHGRAEEMPVLERWKDYQDDSDYLQWVRDPALCRLTHHYFGDVTNGVLFDA